MIVLPVEHFGNHGVDCRLAAPGGTGHQGGKDASLVTLARRQHFRVPLHTDDKGVAGAFDAFDDAVAGYGIDDQATA